MSRIIYRSIAGGLGLCALSALTPLTPAKADYISPNIKDRGHEYSDEKPTSSFYGSGQGGRMVEASELRLAVDGLLRDHMWDEAIRKAKKAVQLDPGYPENHFFLAKGLAGKLYEHKGPIDEKLLQESIHEWNLIRWHDADVSDQLEARAMLSQLNAIAKTLQRDRLLKAKIEQKKKIEEATANLKRAAESKLAAKPVVQSEEKPELSQTVTSDTEKVAGSESPATSRTLEDVANQLAEKPKKRWRLF